VQNTKIHVEVCLMFGTRYMFHLWKSYHNSLAFYIRLPQAVENWDKLQPLQLFIQ